MKKRYPSFPIVPIYGKKKLGEKIKELSGKVKKVGVMGGDGTVNEVIQHLAYSSTALGIIPSGNGNDFSRELGIPMDPEKALRVFIMEDSEETFVDLGKVGDRYFSNSFGIGFDAQVVFKSSENKNYKINALKEALRPSTFEFKGSFVMEEDDNLRMENELLMLVFANGRAEGGGFVINNGSEPLKDKKLGVLMVYPCSIFKRAIFLTDSLRAQLKNRRYMNQFKAVKANLEFSSEVLTHMDGEIQKMKRAHISIHPGALKILTGGG